MAIARNIHAGTEGVVFGVSGNSTVLGKQIPGKKNNTNGNHIGTVDGVQENSPSWGSLGTVPLAVRPLYGLPALGPELTYRFQKSSLSRRQLPRSQPQQEEQPQ